MAVYRFACWVISHAFSVIHLQKIDVFNDNYSGIPSKCKQFGSTWLNKICLNNKPKLTLAYFI